MGFSLFRYLYHLYQKWFQNCFEQYNKVLSQKEIEGLLKDENINKALRIFRSAIVERQKVEDMPCHTKYPISGLICSDGYKKAIIADSITSYSRPLQDVELSEAVIILDHFINPRTECGYAPDTFLEFFRLYWDEESNSHRR